MNGIVEILSEMIPKERDRKIRTVWFLLALVGATLVVSFLVLLLIVRLQPLLSRPLQEYALYAYLGVFFITVLNSSTIIFPAPGMALVLAAASRWDPVWIAIAASMGGSLGELTGYLIGRAGKTVIVADQSEVYKRAERWMRHYGAWVVSFLAGIPLMPFDIVGLVAGGLKYPVGKFLLFCWFGRIPRTFVEVFGGAMLLKWVLHFLFR
ncbi:MAG: VTT domain-containing protein [Chloroflexi bacterium]|nr:VTT domain-containing protein [Chloroflexota bacterium]